MNDEEAKKRIEVWEGLKKDPSFRTSILEIESLLKNDYDTAFSKWRDLANKNPQVPKDAFRLWSKDLDSGKNQPTKQGIDSDRPKSKDNLFVRAIENLKREKKFGAVAKESPKNIQKWEELKKDPNKKAKIEQIEYLIETNFSQALISWNDFCKSNPEVNHGLFDIWFSDKSDQKTQDASNEQKKQEAGDRKTASDHFLPQNHKDNLFFQAVERLKREKKFGAVPVKPDQETIEIVNAAIRRAGVEEISEGRKAEDYKECEGDVYKKWVMEHANVPRLTLLSHLEQFREELDKEYEKRNKEKFVKFLDRESTKIYSKVEEDPILKQLGKIFEKKIENHPSFPNDVKVEKIYQALKQKAPLKTYSLSRTLDLRIARFSKDYQEQEYTSEYFRQAPIQRTQKKAIGTSIVNRVNKTGRLGNRLLKSKASNSRENLGGLPNKYIQKAMTSFGRNLLANFGLELIFLIVLLISIAFILAMLFGLTMPIGEDLQEVTLSKTVDKPHINNPDPQEEVTFTINVGFKGQSSAVITDPIPDNAVFVKANNSPQLLDENGTPTTDPLKVQSVKWTVTSSATTANTTSTSSTSLFNYSSYGFPKPQEPNPVVNSAHYKSWLTQWNSYMSPQAAKVSQLINLDPGIMGGWFLHEENSSTFYDNCDDARGDRDPNTACFPHDGLNWQVGYGIRPLEQYSRLKKAISTMHPNESVKKIGQEVIDNSKRDPKFQIKNPGTFPDVTVDYIIDQAINKKGSQGRLLLGILMKDDAIGTYILGEVMKGYTGMGGKMAGEFKSWSSDFYDPQKVSNSFDAAYKTGTAGPANSGGSSKSLSITLKPKSGVKDTYIVNQAFVEGSKGSEGGICTDVPLSNSKSNTCASNRHYSGQKYTSYKLPDSGNFVKKGSEHWGRPELLRLINDVAARWTQAHPQEKFAVGDLDSTSGHISHKCGVDVDISSSGKSHFLWTDSGYKKELAIELAKMFFDTGIIDVILYNDDSVREVVNNYAKQKNLSGSMAEWPNHYNHFHVRVLATDYECKPSSSTTASTATNKENCQGKGLRTYNLSGNNHNGVNFGDPSCKLASSPLTSVQTGGKKNNNTQPQQALVNLINSLDPTNLKYWIGIAACESFFDPNAYNPNGTDNPAYGLMQMNPGVNGPYTSGNGMNGKYDRGDVNWRLQISNAINHNKDVAKLGAKWKYWACAKTEFGLWK